MIVFITGAGVSKKSGIPTYRDEDGIWNKQDSSILDASIRHKNPEALEQFLSDIQKDIDVAKPNAIHHLIKKFENLYEVHIITQNIDNLHEKAGSSSVIHMHGNIYDKREDGTRDIVLFGEDVMYQSNIIKLLDKCAYLIYVGTSGQVYPANKFYRLTDGERIEINLNRTIISHDMNRVLIGDAEDKLVELYSDLFFKKYHEELAKLDHKTKEVVNRLSRHEEDYAEHLLKHHDTYGFSKETVKKAVRFIKDNDNGKDEI
jgi:NAD-dependent deacetylase